MYIVRLLGLSALKVVLPGLLDWMLFKLSTYFERGSHQRYRSAAWAGHLMPTYVFDGELKWKALMCRQCVYLLESRYGHPSTDLLMSIALGRSIRKYFYSLLLLRLSLLPKVLFLLSTAELIWSCACLHQFLANNNLICEFCIVRYFSDTRIILPCLRLIAIIDLQRHTAAFKIWNNLL